MKYFIECILRCLGTIVGGSNKPMRTTGNSFTLRDGGVGIAGLLGLLAAFFIAFFIFKKVGLGNGRSAIFAMCITVGIFVILLITYFCI